jgi:hypothetical protein
VNKASIETLLIFAVGVDDPSKAVGSSAQEALVLKYDSFM